MLKCLSHHALFVIFLLQIWSLNTLASVQAAETTIYKQVIDLPMDEVYPVLYKALEDKRFYVVFEPNIGKSLKSFAGKWGDNYNKNNLDNIRSMVFCNGWYANQVSNIDPDMLALCPLRVALYDKQGITTILFARPTVIATQSAAMPVLQEVENEVIEAIQNAAKKLMK